MVMTVTVICPQCNKGYGTNTRKDGSIRCRLCGYTGSAMTSGKTSDQNESPDDKGTSVTA
jgi:uncharacterized Zn finger protein (UPF0148 family)